MGTQVVPLVSMSNATDPEFWMEQGWKGALCTVALAALLFAVYKGKVKFVVVSRRNEKGIRELFGMPVWPVYRGAHLHIDGISSVRKAPIVPVPIELRQNILIDRKYTGTAFVQVSRRRKALKQAIYSTLDTDKKDLENEMRDKQSRSIILGGTRRILTNEWDVDVLTKESLNELCATELHDELGSELVKLVNEEYTFAGLHVLPGVGEATAVEREAAAQLAAAMQSGGVPRPHLVPAPADDAG